MGMILCIASSHIVGEGDIVGRSGCFKFKLSANSVMRGRVNAIRTFKGLVADLRISIPSSFYVTTHVINFFRGVVIQTLMWTFVVIEVNSFANFSDTVRKSIYFLVKEHFILYDSI